MTIQPATHTTTTITFLSLVAGCKSPLNLQLFSFQLYFKVNISVAGRAPLRKHEKDTTVGYIYDSAVFVFPPGRPYSSLAKLFFPFKSGVWICAFKSFLAMVIAILILEYISKKTCQFVIGRHNDAPVLNLLSIIVGGSTTTHQLPRRNFARTILIILLLSTLILRNAYLGNLVNFLQTPQENETTLLSTEYLRI